MSKSISDSALGGNNCSPVSVSGGGGVSVSDSPAVPSSLDIHRDFPSVLVVADKMTTKTTEDKTYTKEEKRRWKQEQDRLLQKRDFAARSIVLDYVNGVEGLYSDLPPMAAYAAEEEEIMLRRSQLRSFLKCLRKNDGGPVDLVLYDDESVLLSGLWRCGSLWQCPRCSSIGLYKYSRRLVALLEAVQKENKKRRLENLPCLSVLFCTFTAPHSPGDSLGEEMRLFSSVWSKVLDCWAVRDIRSEYGMVGSVRCFDHTVTLSDNEEEKTDWHTHFHNLLVFDPMEGNGEEIKDKSAAACDVARVLFDEWSKRVRKQSGKECSEKAFKVEVVDLVSDDRSDHAIADYAAKVFCLPGYMTKSQKRRKGEKEDCLLPPFRSLAPFDLLDAYNAWGDRAAFDYAGAWIEYCVETKGFHRVQFSKGLEARFGLSKCKEKEACPVCRHTLPGAVADVALSHSDVMSDLKEAVVADDAVVYWDILEPLGLGWAADDVAEEKPIKEKMLGDAERALGRFRLMRDLRQDISEEENGEEEKEAWRLVGGLGLAGLLSGWSGVAEKEESLFFGVVNKDDNAEEVNEEKNKECLPLVVRSTC